MSYLKSKLFRLGVLAVASMFAFTGCKKSEDPLFFNKGQMFLKNGTECISVNGNENATDLVAQGKGNSIGSVIFAYNDDGKLTVTIIENTGKKLNNAGVAFDKVLGNLLQNYSNGNNIVVGKVSNANAKYITSNGYGEVVFTFEDDVFETGETYYFVVYCSQGWGAGQAYGNSGLNGGNGYVIAVTFNDCNPEIPDYSTATVNSISEVPSLLHKDEITTLIITGIETADFAGIKNINSILPNIANVELSNFAGTIPVSLFENCKWIKSFSANMATHVGQYAFLYSTAESITLRNVRQIDYAAFAFCSDLKIITLGAPETPAITFGNSVFWNEDWRQITLFLGAITYDRDSPFIGSYQGYTFKDIFRIPQQ